MGCTQASSDKLKKQVKFFSLEEYNKKTTKPILITLSPEVNFIFKEKWENVSIKNNKINIANQKEKTTLSFKQGQNNSKKTLQEIKQVESQNSSLKENNHLFQKLKLQQASLDKQIRRTTQKNQNLLQQTSKNQQSILKQKAFKKYLEYKILVESNYIDSFKQKIQVTP